MGEQEMTNQKEERMSSCTTHHICDCLKKKLEMAENVVDATKVLLRGLGSTPKTFEELQTDLHRALREYEAANG